MKYREIADGIFVDRPNRFIAHVEVNGAVETVHVKNTGRCRELLLPGTAVRLEVSDNPKRKTKYDLVAVHKQGLGWVNTVSYTHLDVYKRQILIGVLVCNQVDRILQNRPDGKPGERTPGFVLMPSRPSSSIRLEKSLMLRLMRSKR